MIGRAVFIAIVVCVALFEVNPAAIAARSAPVFIQSIDVGFAGKYKVGYWSPVRVRVNVGDTASSKSANEDVHLEIVVPDGDGVPCRFRSAAVPLTATSAEDNTFEIELPVKFGRIKNAVQITLVEDAEPPNVLAQRQFFDEVPVALPSTRELIVCVGSSPEIDAANRMQRRSSLEQIEVALIGDAKPLPSDALAYDGVDWLIVSTSKPKQLPSLEVCQAIENWISIGGKLLLVAGQQAEALDQATPKIFGRFLPGKFSKYIPLSRLPGIVSYSETSEAIESEPGNSRIQIKVPQLTDVQGRIEAYEGHDARELPLVVRTPRGFGMVVWCGLDLDQIPFSKWPGQKQLLNRLLGRPTQASDDKNEELFSQTGGSTGYLDLSGQLRSSLEQFDRVQFIPFWQVGSLAALYLVLLGPIDYYLLKRLRRPELTWITFPILAAVFCYGAFHYAYVAKGDRTQVNQVDLIDIDAHDQLVRGHSWITVFSPESRTDSLSLAPVGQATGLTTLPAVASNQSSSLAQTTDGQLSWLGLPGVGIGGMDSSAASPALFIEPYDVQSHQMDVSGVPLAIWSTKGFEASYRTSSRADDSEKIELTETSSHQLRGTLTNPLHVELTEAVLYFDRWSYVLGKLPADFSDKIENRFQALSIDAAITHRKMQGDKDMTEPYDRTDSDPARILQLMMFHEAAGGRHYSRLLNRYDHRLDLAAHLRLGQAMLVGIGPPKTELSYNGQPLPENFRGKRLTVYRYLFPVNLQEK